MVPSDDPSGDPPDTDEVLAALSDSRRRRLLTALDGEREASLRDLAVRVAAREEGKPAGDVTDDERKSVRVSLYHAHVPKLADAGVVEYDDATRTISPGRGFRHAVEILDTVEGHLAGEPDDDDTGRDGS